MKVRLEYGRTGYGLTLPDAGRVTVHRSQPPPHCRSDEAALEETYARPEGTRPLEELARGAGSACILICDRTRPVPNGLLLPPLLRSLHRAGLRRETITVLVATGLHRPAEGDELREVLGDPRISSLACVCNHLARNPDDHCRIGTTSDGTPIRIDRRFASAELKIVVGLIEPHFMAGFSGGRKLIVPGIADESTIRRFHAARLLAHACAEIGELDGNPVHRFQMEAARMLGPVQAVNVVLDDERKPVFLNFGDLVESHRVAVDFYLKYNLVTIQERFPTVITSAAGFPLDATYYQTVKALVAASRIVTPGGRIYAFSRCGQGLGSADFLRAQRRLLELGPQGFLDAIRDKPMADIDAWQTQMLVRALQRTGSIHLFSGGLSAADFALTGVKRCRHPEQEIASFVAGIQDRRVAVIPRGPYLLVRTGDRP